MSEVSIRVIGRFRPINGREKEEQAKEGWADDDVVPFEVKEERGIEVLPAPKEGRPVPQMFTVDHVLWNCSQVLAFETIALPTVKDIMKGYNGTIFAYGQTGSGKTFSMFGPEVAAEDMNDAALENMGLIPRSCFWLFEQLQNHPSIESYEVKLSALEIYIGNQLRDLLHPRTKGMKIRDGVKGVFVQGLQYKPVKNVIDVLQYIEIATSHRTVSATKMNATSSRSHSVFTFEIRFTLDSGKKTGGKLNFADLAGSEKVGKTGATGTKLQEGAAINQSLTVLGRVISALAKGKVAPFRESGLTHVLKDSLSGNTKTTLLVCLSPHKFNVFETINTLQFAGRAKMIKNKIKVNKVLSMKDMKRELKRLNKENADLKAQLRKKLTKATTLDAPEKGLPYLKMTFSEQAEPASDAQYIMRRKEVQMEIKKLIALAGLTGITVETEVRRSNADSSPNAPGDLNLARLPSIAEGEESEDAPPLVVHLLFQPSDAFSGEKLINAKDTFVTEIMQSKGIFASVDIEEGFANPKDYGASLSVNMQRKVLNDLQALELERDHLQATLNTTQKELKELQEKLKTHNLDEMDAQEKAMQLQREIVELQDENVSLKATNLANTMSMRNLMTGLGDLSPTPSSDGSLTPTGTKTPLAALPGSARKKKKTTPANLPPTINEDEDYEEEDNAVDFDDKMGMEELEARMQAMAGVNSPGKSARTPRKPRTSFIAIDASLSPLFNNKTPGSPMSSGFQFPERKKTERSKLRRTLSVREEFREISTDDTFNIQDNSLADLKLVCKQLQEQKNPLHERLVEIRNLLKHTVNRMRIVCDELTNENEDHEEYVALMKEQLDTRHKELDSAYEDIELLRGALEKRQTMIEDDTIAIALDGPVIPLPDVVSPSVGGDFVDGEEVVEATSGDKAGALPPVNSLQPSNRASASFSGKPRTSFVEVVGLVSQKLAHLRSGAQTEKLEFATLTPTGSAGAHFRDETIAGIWFDEEKEVIDWTVTDVVKWLEDINDGALDRYIDQFEDLGVTGEALLSFTRYDLLNDFNMDREHIKMFYKALSEKSELVKMRLKDARNRHERKKRKRGSGNQNPFVSQIIRHDKYDEHIKKLWEKEFGKKGKILPIESLYPGDLVDVGGGRMGRIFYKGEISGKAGLFVGIELHEGIGKHDGIVNKKRYFRTLPNQGMFTKKVYKVIKLRRSNSKASMTNVSETAPSNSSPDSKHVRDVDIGSSGSLSGSFQNLHERVPTGISESGDDSFDLSFSDSSDDEMSDTVTFGHNRQFSMIPTVKVSDAMLDNLASRLNKDVF